MNYISNNFKIQIDSIIKALSSKRIKFFKPREFNLEELASLEWTLKLEEPESILQPTNSVLYKDRNGNLNVRFSGYLPAITNEDKPVKKI